MVGLVRQFQPNTWLFLYCFCFSRFVLFIYLKCADVLLKRFTVDSLVVCTASLLSLSLFLSLFLCHLALTVILLHFLLVFILLCFLLHLRTDFLSLFLLSNSIHERCTLHHSVSLYLCLPFIFSTPFCTRARWKEGGRKKQRDGWGERERKRWTD